MDAWFLYAEEDGVNHMNILSFIVLEGPPPPYEDLLALVDEQAAAAAAVPAGRAHSAALQIGRPVWVDDAELRPAVPRPPDGPAQPR